MISKTSKTEQRSFSHIASAHCSQRCTSVTTFDVVSDEGEQFSEHVRIQRNSAASTASLLLLIEGASEWRGVHRHRHSWRETAVDMLLQKLGNNRQYQLTHGRCRCRRRGSQCHIAIVTILSCTCRSCKTQFLFTSVNTALEYTENIQQNLNYWDWLSLHALEDLAILQSKETLPLKHLRDSLDCKYCKVNQQYLLTYYSKKWNVTVASEYSLCVSWIVTGRKWLIFMSF